MAEDRRKVVAGKMNTSIGLANRESCETLINLKDLMLCGDVFRIELGLLIV